MPTVAERISVVEVQVTNLDEKLDDIKVDVKDMHDCLDRTRDLLDSKLETMLVEYRTNRDNFYAHSNIIHAENKKEHAELAGKITELEKQKHKITLYLMIGLAFMAGAGMTGTVTFPTVLKFFGI